MSDKIVTIPLEGGNYYDLSDIYELMKAGIITNANFVINDKIKIPFPKNKRTNKHKK